jgi:Protein of unknown function (DUF1176)
MKFILALFTVAFASYSHATAQTATQSYRDWSVTCDNIKTCVAFSLSSQSEGGQGARATGLSPDVPEGWLLIERAAGPGSVARIRISAPSLAETPVLAGSFVRLLASNGSTLPRGQFPVIATRDGGVQIAPAAVRGFIGLARSASHLVFVSRQSARPDFVVSLSGLVASVRAMDAQQGRTNNVTALIDVGRINAARVPAAPALPIVSAQAFSKRANSTPPAELLTLRTSDCEDGEQLDNNIGRIEAYDIGRISTLWAVPCGAGAYNTWSRYYIQNRSGSLRPVRFSGSQDRDDEDVFGLMNPSVIPARGTITVFSKGRGLGDCGEAATYAWTGKTFVLAQFNEMQPCGGIVSTYWPSVRTSRIVTAPARR